MPSSPRMSWPTIAENQDPWFDAFTGLVNAIDASCYASREDRHAVLMGGGIISFTAATGLLTWAASLEVLAAVTGYLWTLPAGQVTLQDGEIFYVNLVRAPQSGTGLAAQHAMQVPTTDQGFLLAIRRGIRVYFRNGAVALDGHPGAIIQNPGSGGGGVSPLTTKGDLYTHDATDDVRLPVGSDGQVLLADSTQVAGVRWGDPPAGSTAAFDKFTGTGVQVNFNLSHLVDITKLTGVLVHRNGMLLDKVTTPALVDEYSVNNVGGVTRVTFGAAPSLTDRIFVTYGY
jgi:hypothetical protein